ncbi:SDR family oxidoreductase [Kribbella sp. CA-253562]|uniref:SDR family oxidoreductase n=1 Tax=Kribbella sp. CA-253562 TaxID=3239942 RepID=UPI003D8B0BD2
MSGVSGRVVLVTGGSRGIGAAIVRALAARGVRVGCGYVSSQAAAERLADEFPGLVVPVAYRLGDAESARAAVTATVAEWGRLDGVVANAGVWAGGRITTMDEDDWFRVVADNLQGVAQLSRAALPHLAAAESASVTIVSSVIGLIGGPGDTAYASAKAGLFGFGRALAKEVARDGIRVNLLAPGFVETDMTSRVPDSSREEIARSILLRRFGQAEEIASAAVYLSEDATYCTGSILTVDGGWSL